MCGHAPAWNRGSFVNIAASQSVAFERTGTISRKARSVFLGSIAAGAFLFVGGCVRQVAPQPVQAAYPHGASICGWVVDGTRDYSSDEKFIAFERLCRESVAAKGPEAVGRDKAVLKALSELVMPHKSMSDVVVTVRSANGPADRPAVFRTTSTGADGRFTFESVPAGEYEVTAEIRRGWFRRETEVRRRVPHGDCQSSYVQLEYIPNLAVVRGRITDTAGRPIRSARVTATHHVYNAEASEVRSSHALSAITDSHGAYEIRGLLPGDAYRGPEKYEFRVEAAGYVTVEKSIPAMTGEVRIATERLWGILFQSLEPGSEERLKELKAALPACRGRVTPGVDFVLVKSSIPLEDGRTSAVQFRF